DPEVSRPPPPHLPAKAIVHGTRSPSTRGLIVIHIVARTLRFALLSGLVFIFCGGPFLSRSAGAEPLRKTVYLAGAVSHDETLVFTSAVAGVDPQAIIIFDSPLTTPYLKSFLDALNPETIIPVGSFRDGVDDLRHRLGRSTAGPLVWDRGRPQALWSALFP